MTTKRFALIYGIVFVIIGLAGFVPGLAIGHSHPDMEMTTGLGLLFGLFPVNILHNLVHLVFGVWGLAAAKSVVGAVTYAKAVAVIYAILAILGLMPVPGLQTTFGLIPLYGHDIWLHILLAAGAAYFGFVRSPADSSRAVPSR
ncbi:DUF4383 domain-containing protein [Hydrogenophaga sp.]|uniref:DUF4383 domain-containing protein n=1 Tax=Hydrogenophaga sp. TaxID=1904254 RepID=UPI003F716BAE